MNQNIQLVTGTVRCTGKAGALKLCVLSLMCSAVEGLNQREQQWFLCQAGTGQPLEAQPACALPGLDGHSQVGGWRCWSSQSCSL